MTNTSDLPIIEPTLDELQQELGASLTNLLERCITFPRVPIDDPYRMTVEYIRNNAQHVKNLMVKAQKMMEDNAVMLVENGFRDD